MRKEHKRFQLIEPYLQSNPTISSEPKEKKKQLMPSESKERDKDEKRRVESIGEDNV